MSDNPRRIEREFGVPFPGELRPPAEWTQTALKSIDGILDFPSLFQRNAPVTLDIGCGNGRSTIHHAIIHPHHDVLGIDPLPVVIRYARRRGNQRAITNVKFAVMGGRELLEHHIAPGSIAEIHVYHPQPYYDASQVYKRLITPLFLSLVHTALIDGGLFVIQTDNPGYWRYMQEVVPLFFDFTERIGRWPDAPKGRTRREILALKRGLPIFRGTGTKKAIAADDVRELAERLPPPTFNADRRLRELDKLA